MRTAFVDSLCRLAEADCRIQLVVGDLGYSVVEPFATRFPERFLNAGVAEQSMMGLAAGLALSGRIVFVYSIANFSTLRCLEQIRNDVCYHNADVKIVTVGGGLAYGAQGYTHHGVEDLAIMGALPNLAICCPADAHETRALMPAIAGRAGPLYLRLGRGGEPDLHDPTASVAFGRAATLREGSDIAFLGCGSILGLALRAAEAVASEGISARVLSFPTIAPLDHEAIVRAARETRALITVEEHSVRGGFGTMVADALMERGVTARLRKFGVTEATRGAIGSQAYLRGLMGDLAHLARASA